MTVIYRESKKVHCSMTIYPTVPVAITPIMAIKGLNNFRFTLLTVNYKESGEKFSRF